LGLGIQCPDADIDLQNRSVHLGLVIILNLMIGPITPATGLSVFMVTNVASISRREVPIEMPPISSA
jgi:TRAP-type C4-dicarboxylate transport system permease large subunit